MHKKIADQPSPISAVLCRKTGTFLHTLSIFLYEAPADKRKRMID